MKYLISFLLSISLSFGQDSGDALTFDGINDYIQTGYTGITGDADRTVEAWIKLTDSGINFITEWGSSLNFQRFTLTVTNNKLRVEFAGGGISSNQAVNDGDWHHVAVTHSSTASTSTNLYIDGNLVKSGNYTLNTSSTGNVVIGRSSFWTGREFNGSIEEVRIWDDVRTAEEIRAGMFHTISTIPSPSNLQLYFNMDNVNTNGGGVMDESGNGNSGTMVNMTSGDIVTSTAPIKVFQVNGQDAIGVWSGSALALTTSSDGLFLQSTSLLMDGNYAVASHDNGGVSEVTSDLPSGVEKRYVQTWELELQGMVNAHIIFDLGELTKDLSFDISSAIASNYKLLYRPGSSGNFSELSSANNISNSDQIFFANVPLNMGEITIGSSNLSVSPLPVELYSFEGAVINKEIVLGFKTASERNNDFFTVYKSRDLKKWRYVNSLNALSEGSNSYNLNDVYKEGFNYYKLTQTDLDGTNTTLDIIYVNYHNIIDDVNYYPSPCRGYLNISNGIDLKQVKIYNNLGELVFNKIGEQGFLTHLDISYLPNGVYLIELLGDSSIKKGSFIIE